MPAGALAPDGLLTATLDAIGDGASSYEFAVSGMLLIAAAITFPAGIVGYRVRRETA